MASGPTDLRKGIDGYSAIVSSMMYLDPFEKILYFIDTRARDMIKLS